MEIHTGILKKKSHMHPRMYYAKNNLRQHCLLFTAFLRLLSGRSVRQNCSEMLRGVSCQTLWLCQGTANRPPFREWPTAHVWVIPVICKGLELPPLDPHTGANHSKILPKIWWTSWRTGLSLYRWNNRGPWFKKRAAVRVYCREQLKNTEGNHRFTLTFDEQNAKTKHGWCPHTQEMQNLRKKIHHQGNRSILEQDSKLSSHVHSDKTTSRSNIIAENFQRLLRI